jgi:hypothetical protein
VHARVEQRTCLPFVVEGMLGNNCLTKVKVHRLLHPRSEHSHSSALMYIPIGFGEVSIVYKSFIDCISYK